MERSTQKSASAPPESAESRSGRQNHPSERKMLRRDYEMDCWEPSLQERMTRALDFNQLKNK